MSSSSDIVSSYEREKSVEIGFLALDDGGRIKAAKGDEGLARVFVGLSARLFVLCEVIEPINRTDSLRDANLVRFLD